MSSTPSAVSAPESPSNGSNEALRRRTLTSSASSTCSVLRDARSAISAIDGVRPRVAVSSSAAIATVRLASFARRVTWTDHVLSRKCRRSSPRIVGTANVLNASPRAGSNRSTALTSPRNATCTRSSRDSPRCANRCAQYDASHAWSSTRALRIRRSPLARHCSNRGSSVSRERSGGVTAPPSITVDGCRAAPTRQKRPYTEPLKNAVAAKPAGDPAMNQTCRSPMSLRSEVRVLHHPHPGAPGPRLAAPAVRQLLDQPESPSAELAVAPVMDRRRAVALVQHLEAYLRPVRAELHLDAAVAMHHRIGDELADRQLQCLSIGPEAP